MGFKKILGATLVFTASIAMFVYFFILNVDFWTKLTTTGWTILIAILAVLFGGIYIWFNSNR